MIRVGGALTAELGQHRSQFLNQAERHQHAHPLLEPGGLQLVIALNREDQADKRAGDDDHGEGSIADFVELRHGSDPRARLEQPGSEPPQHVPHEDTEPAERTDGL